MPSFSAKAKENLCRVSMRSIHCAAAELAGIVHACGSLALGSGGMHLRVTTENKHVVNRVFSLVRTLYDHECQLSQSSNQLQKEIYQIRLQPPDMLRLFRDMAIPAGFSFTIDPAGELFAQLTAQECCRAAYLRGGLLGGGVISDPLKKYHMEFTVGSEGAAEAIISVLAVFGITAKRLERKNGYSVYLKDAQSISEVLTITGAHSCVLELENARMLKDIRNNVNRQVNFENANIDKVVRSAMAQAENIRLIATYKGLDSLSPALRETAELRLNNPEASLGELAALSDGVSRSGMNNRLRKLAEIADSIRESTPNLT